MYSDPIDFIYEGKKLSDFENPMFIGYIDKLDDSFGLDREVISGNTTLNRNVYHSFGTKYGEKLHFEIALFHKNQSSFNRTELSSVTKWLSSPKSYRRLQFIDYDGQKSDITYFAVVTRITPHTSGQGIVGIKVEFECNSSYGFVEKTSSILNTINDPSSDEYKLNVTINCDSDELEEYVYPIVEIKTTAWDNVKVINHSDNDRAMDLYNLKSGKYSIDCLHQIITLNGDAIKLSDLFLIKKINNLYWFRLVPGENEIEINGRCLVLLKWLEPKKVGAF